MSQPPRAPSRSDRDLAAALALVEQLQPALERRDRARQNDIVGKLVALAAPMGEQWRALANLAARNGEVSLGRAAIDRYVDASGGTPFARYVKAAFLEQCGALGEAYDLLCALPPDVPDRASHAQSRGTSALYLGKAAEAREYLGLATRLQPHAGPAWLLQAMAADLSRDEELAERILAAEREMGKAAPAQRAPYYYALGKLHADRGEHAAAFAAFARGAAEMKPLAPYDRAAARRHAEESLRGYDAERIAAIARRQSEPTGRTIFVTGLPRSGTTLVEQILTSHSAVSDGAEVSRLGLLASEIGGHSHPALERYVAAHGVADAARLWNHWMDERFPARGRVVDKALHTTRFVGLAAALLPEAPLVWLTRDPLDRAWSCFRTFFAASLPWSFDLADIAHHFRLEDELLRRWQDILGERLLVVPYEKLVDDPRPWIGRILAHCGLPEEPQVFSPHETARAVTTASVAQVRRPINRAGVGSAVPYRAFLEPFVAAYRA